MKRVFLVFVTGLVLAAALWQRPVSAQDRPTIIDVHIHALPVAGYPICPLTGVLGVKLADGSDVCAHPFVSPQTDDELRRMTFAAFERYNMLAVVTGPDLSVLDAWHAQKPDRVLQGLQTTGEDVALTILREKVASGQVKVIGEVAAQYAGMRPDDPKLEPLFALAEELDVPLGIHVAAIGAPNPNLRIALGDPLFLEPVLVRHPRLRLYVMHAGFPFLDQMAMLMRRFSNIYVDVSMIDWQMPRDVLYRYLKGLLDYGLGKRIMFGTDQVSWPQAIDVAIDGIRSAPFLTDGQKQDIFYDNAARFLRIAARR